MKDGFSANQLKWIALTCMILDHVAFGILKPSELFTEEFRYLLVTAMRLAGRVAFPLYAFFIAEGACHTKNRMSYGLRLFLCAGISEIPFNLIYSADISCPQAQNTIWTLLLGFLAICAGDLAVKKMGMNTGHMQSVWYARIAVGIPFALAALGLRTDYDFLGVLLVVFFYTFREIPRLRNRICGIFVCCMYLLSFYSITALAAIWLISRYNGKKGKKGGKIFYLFYPAHLAIIGGIRVIFGL